MANSPPPLPAGCDYLWCDLPPHTANVEHQLNGGPIEWSDDPEPGI
ncbi:hypothetical protein QEH68_06805 [Paenarthrobacter sp. OM7]|nr:hypothetical protein [Paenarthrobacter sp. OM7]WGM21878.1 hypothetical protein QEH68_06805 [Paenarthrobacter sp. OM7]